MASHRTLPVITERFTIGGALAHSWRAFLGDRRWYLIVAILVTSASLVQTHLSSDVDQYGSLTEFFYTTWISGAILSLAVMPITLGVIEPEVGRVGMLEHVRNWRRTLQIVFASCVLQTAGYWPLAVMMELGLDSEADYTVIGFGILSINVLAVGTLSFLFYPILLAERCSMWSSAVRSIRQVRPHFWRIAVLTMFVWLFYIGGSVLVTIVTYAVDESMAGWVYYAAWGPWIVGLVLAANVNSAAVYRLLRAEREGPDPNHVAAVFE